MARAIYQDRDIYLLDDCLSAVDSHVAVSLMNDALLGLLKDKTRILCTHQLQFLQNSDQLLVLNPTGLKKKKVYFKTKSNLNKNTLGGQIAEQGTYANLRADENSNLSKLITSHIIEKGSEQTNKQAQQDNTNTDANKDPSKQTQNDEKKESQQMTEEDRQIGKVSWSIYMLYNRSLAVNAVLFLLVLLYMGDNLSKGKEMERKQEKKRKKKNEWFEIFPFLLVAADYALSFWSQAEDATERLGFYAGLYSALSLGTILFSYFRTMIVFYSGLRASRILHAKMLGRVLRAPMHFFDTTPIGRFVFERRREIIFFNFFFLLFLFRVLNRFSKDFDNIDQWLPDNYTWLVK